MSQPTTPPAESVAQRSRRHARQFVKFGVVGGSGVVVNMLVAILMTRLHGGVRYDNAPLFHVTSRHAFRFTHLVWIAAFVVANFWNFELNRRWTFKRDRQRGWWQEFWPFFVVGSVAAAAGLLIKTALTNDTSPFYLSSAWFDSDKGLHARAYWAQLLTIVLTMPINFVVNKLWTFRAVKHHAADELPLAAPVVDPDDVDPEGRIGRPSAPRTLV